MKTHKLVLTVLFLVLATFAKAQPDVLEQLKQRYEIPNGIRARVTIQVEVPGIKVPQKTIELTAENGKSPKIKGEGLTLLPKKGMMRQFTEILNDDAHWIATGEDQQYAYFKLVSLDPKSDWVTADISVFKADPRIDLLVLTTKDAGQFTLAHHYQSGDYPVQTVVTFESKKMALPLKFLGKSDAETLKNPDELVQGKIIIDFDDLTVY